VLDDRKMARAMGARAAKLVRQEFNLDLTVSRYVAAYKELLDDSPRSKLRTVRDGTNQLTLGREGLS
jgi:hypothetical protein